MLSKGSRSSSSSLVSSEDSSELSSNFLFFLFPLFPPFRGFPFGAFFAFFFSFCFSFSGRFPFFLLDFARFNAISCFFRAREMAPSSSESLELESLSDDITIFLFWAGFVVGVESSLSSSEGADAKASDSSSESLESLPPVPHSFADAESRLVAVFAADLLGLAADKSKSSGTDSSLSLSYPAVRFTRTVLLGDSFFFLVTFLDALFVLANFFFFLPPPLPEPVNRYHRLGDDLLFVSDELALRYAEHFLRKSTLDEHAIYQSYSCLHSLGILPNVP
jgi:hypothetical protein